MEHSLYLMMFAGIRQKLVICASEPSQTQNVLRNTSKRFIWKWRSFSVTSAAIRPPAKLCSTSTWGSIQVRLSIPIRSRHNEINYHRRFFHTDSSFPPSFKNNRILFYNNTLECFRWKAIRVWIFRLWLSNLRPQLTATSSHETLGREAVQMSTLQLRLHSSSLL